MKKIVGLVISLSLLAMGATVNEAFADQPTAFDVCSSTGQMNCIESFSIDGPGTSGEKTLTKEIYSSSGPIFNTAGTGFSPSVGGTRLQITAATTTHPLLPGFAGGTQLSQVSIFNPDAADSLVNGIDPNTTYKVVVATTAAFPWGGYAAVRNGAYSIDFRNGIYYLTIKAMPLQKLANASVNGSQQMPTVAISDRAGVFNLSFNPVTTYPFVYSGRPASGDQAWQIMETNASSMQVPTWGNDTLGIAMAGPHYMSDGVTLNEGNYRLVMTDEMVTDIFKMSVDQARNGALVAQTSENGGALGAIGATVNWTFDANGSSSNFVELKLDPFHYSSRDIKISGSTALKTSTMTWSGKKTSIKKKALTVKATVKSSKKKAAGTLKVELVNNSGVTAASSTASVRKGAGKVIFSKSLISALPQGIYTVRLTFFGSGTAKNTTKNYRLTVK